jgi:uncharacterized protein YcbK (DUF882 family)
MSLKHFKREEFDCQVSGTNNMEMDFLEKLDELRTYCGFPFVITSGYRHPTMHPIEKKKEVPGTHAQGIAADIKITNAADRFALVNAALKLGFTEVLLLTLSTLTPVAQHLLCGHTNASYKTHYAYRRY